MSDLILQPAGLRPLSAANSSVWASPLASLARLGGNLVGSASFTADSSPRSSVPLAAGLSGFLGTGGAAPAATPMAPIAAAQGPVQGSLSEYLANWSNVSASQGPWHTVGGRAVPWTPPADAGSAPVQTAGAARTLLSWQEGTAPPSQARTSWTKVPTVHLESQWPAASSIVASRLVGSSENRAIIHFDGRNPWSNADGNLERRTAVWQVMQQDETLRFDADRGMFFRTASDGTTRDVVSVDNIVNLRRLAGGNEELASRLIGQHVHILATTETRAFPDLVVRSTGADAKTEDSSSLTVVDLPAGETGETQGPGNNGNGNATGNPNNGNNGQGNDGDNGNAGGNNGNNGNNGDNELPLPPGTPGTPGVPGTPGTPGIPGIPGPYPYPPSAGIPGPYPYPPSAGIPGSYPYPPSAGIPGSYPYPPSAGIPGSYPYPPSVGIPGNQVMDYPALIGCGCYPDVPLTGMPGPFLFAFSYSTQSLG